MVLELSKLEQIVPYIVFTALFIYFLANKEKQKSVL